LSQYSLSVFPGASSFQLFFTMSPLAFLNVALDSILPSGQYVLIRVEERGGVTLA
jgi:hypothetical protein